MEDFKCIEKNELLATEEIRCDAIAAFFDRTKVATKNGVSFKLAKSGDIIPIASNRSKSIKPGKKYIEYMFVDENGEQYVLNISKEMESVVKRNKLFYPDYINQQLT